MPNIAKPPCEEATILAGLCSGLPAHWEPAGHFFHGSAR
jgi:hypothetical protein